MISDELARMIDEYATTAPDDFEQIQEWEQIQEQEQINNFDIPKYKGDEE